MGALPAVPGPASLAALSGAGGGATSWRTAPPASPGEPGIRLSMAGTLAAAWASAGSAVQTASNIAVPARRAVLLAWPHAGRLVSDFPLPLGQGGAAGGSCI